MGSGLPEKARRGYHLHVFAPPILRVRDPFVSDHANQFAGGPRQGRDR